MIPAGFRTISLLCLTILSCSSPVGKPDPHGGSRQAQLQPHTTILSFGEEFARFWAKAQGQPFEFQMRLWDELVEKPQQLFYDSVVWQKRDHPRWFEQKRRLLPGLFRLYGGHYAEIQERFQEFPKVAREQLARFQEVFPDARLDFPIYAALSPTFNAKSAVLDTADRTIVLAFGVDTFLAIHDRYELVYPHELFHVYHALRSGFTNDGVMEGVSLAVPLWAEGLATYVSGIFNPGATDSELLDEEELGRLPGGELPELARLFLRQADQPAVDPVHPETFKAWFSVGSLRPRPGLPGRCGYLLGLYVVRRLAKSHTLGEMAGWTPKQAVPHVLEMLHAF